jgi:hypothetical protein
MDWSKRGYRETFIDRMGLFFFGANCGGHCCVMTEEDYEDEGKCAKCKSWRRAEALASIFMIMNCFPRAHIKPSLRTRIGYVVFRALARYLYWREERRAGAV